MWRFCSASEINVLQVCCSSFFCHWQKIQKEPFFWCSLTARLWNKLTAHTQEPLAHERRESLIKTHFHSLKLIFQEMHVVWIWSKALGFFCWWGHTCQWCEKHVRAVKSGVKPLLETITPSIRTSCGSGRVLMRPLTLGISEIKPEMTGAQWRNNCEMISNIYHGTF